MPQVDIDINGIMKVLPHRYPFLLIDKIVEIEPAKKVVAIKNVTMNENFFQGHFPEFPIMPGVLVVEAIAQTGAYGLLVTPEYQGKIALFAGIDGIRFRKPVFPGDQIRIEVEYLKSKGPIAKMRGVAKIGDQIVCEGEFMCSISDANTGSKQQIHKTAVIHPSAVIGQGVKIGPYTVIGPEVTIGDNTEIASNVLIGKWTKIGKECRILNSASIGTPPQDLKYKGEKSWVEIGDRCLIREFVTVHLPTGEGQKTSIGNDCMIMTNVHIPHNAKVGNNVIMSSFSALSGHAEVDDFVIIGGMTGVHQFVRIGKMAMIGGHSRITQDVPPFMIAEGNPAQIRALNSIGLQRRGVPFESQVELKKAFKIIYKSGNNLSKAIDSIKKQCAHVDEIKLLLDFLEKETGRGILKKIEAADELIFEDIPEIGI